MRQQTGHRLPSQIPAGSEGLSNPDRNSKRHSNLMPPTASLPICTLPTLRCGIGADSSTDCVPYLGTRIWMPASCRSLFACQGTTASKVRKAWSAARFGQRRPNLDRQGALHQSRRSKGWVSGCAAGYSRATQGLRGPSGLSIAAAARRQVAHRPGANGQPQCTLGSLTPRLGCGGAAVRQPLGSRRADGAVAARLCRAFPRSTGA